MTATPPVISTWTRQQPRGRKAVQARRTLPHVARQGWQCAVWPSRHSFVGVQCLQICEKVLLNTYVLNDPRLGTDTEFVLLQQVAQAATIDQIHRRCTIPRRLRLGFTRERTSSDQQAFVSSTSHRTAEVPNCTGPDAASIPLALEEHRERHQRHPVDPEPVNSAVTRAAGHRRADEAGLSEQALRESFESIR